MGEWLSRALLSGPSVITWRGDRIEGHVVFVPDDTGKHELAILVHRAYQHAGIGDVLVETGVRPRPRGGVSQLWFTVEPWNESAKVYAGHGVDTVAAYGSIHRMSRYQ